MDIDQKTLTKVWAQGETFPDHDLIPFLRESLQIEGIHRNPRPEEIDATRRFMQLFSMSDIAIIELQAIYAPGHPLREQPGMNVFVGRYVAPKGGPRIRQRLRNICFKVNRSADPWETHIEYEALHPFLDGNGRTGRTLWAWQMHAQGSQPFGLPFLHRYYYQTLANRGPVVAAKWRD